MEDNAPEINWGLNEFTKENGNLFEYKNLFKNSAVYGVGRLVSEMMRIQRKR